MPKEEFTSILVAYGFHKEVTIQDFPFRGNTVYLHVKRRRWLDKESKDDWNLVAQGT
ncbi:ISAon1 family transposase N-terminal region protein [Lutibacter sp. A64]|uniref:ISAon1 family transposase N-terminal region protein n=1 Tax=Lutibacter sp. A64 TaxID=2918526 RepID=UPI003F8D3F19